MGNNILLVLLTKLFLFGAIYLFYFETNQSKKLVFYQNFGISRTLLFVLSFLYDAILTILILKIASLF